MSKSIQDTMDEIIAFIYWNQKEKVDGVEENYVSNIADELDMSRPRVMRSLNWLENNVSMVKSWKKGNKILYRLRHDPYENIDSDSSAVAEDMLDFDLSE